MIQTFRVQLVDDPGSEKDIRARDERDAATLFMDILDTRNVEFHEEAQVDVTRNEGGDRSITTRWLVQGRLERVYDASYVREIARHG